MVKFVQILSLKNMLSKLIICKETLLRQTSFQASSLNQTHSQEMQVKTNNEVLKNLESKCSSLKQESQEEYIQIMEQTIKLLDQQLQLINTIMNKQNNRNQIKYSSLRSNILEKAAKNFYEIWQFDSKNIEYLRKYLDIIKCFKGTLSDQYLEGLCKYAQSTQDHQELAEIYSQIEKKNFSETQKKCAMTLFMLTQNEIYYEDFLLNDSNLSDQSFEIRFHLFATQYFQRQNCYHTTKYHRQQCESMSSEYQRSIALSNLELQLSFMKNKSNHGL